MYVWRRALLLGCPSRNDFYASSHFTFAWSSDASSHFIYLIFLLLLMTQSSQSRRCPTTFSFFWCLRIFCDHFFLIQFNAIILAADWCINSNRCSIQNKYIRSIDDLMNCWAVFFSLSISFFQTDEGEGAAISMAGITFRRLHLNHSPGMYLNGLRE